MSDALGTLPTPTPTMYVSMYVFIRPVGSKPGEWNLHNIRTGTLHQVYYLSEVYRRIENLQTLNKREDVLS